MSRRWPWKKVWRRVVPIVGLVALASGVSGFLLAPELTQSPSLCIASCSEPQRWLAAFIKTLQLFVLNVPTIELRHCASWVAAVLAPVATGGLAIAAFGDRARRWVERIGLFLNPATDVFLGGGDTATGLAARREGVGRMRSKKLVGLDIASSAALDRAMEDFEVRSFMHVGDALTRDALAPFQLHLTKNVWIATGDDYRNLEVTRLALAEIHQHEWPWFRRWPSDAWQWCASRLRRGPGKTGGVDNDKDPVRVLVNVYDRRLTRAKNELFAGHKQDHAMLEFFSMPRLAARALLLKHPPHWTPGAQAPHLLVMGDGELAAALVVHAAQHVVYSEQPSQCVRISLVGAGSRALHTRLLLMFPALAADSEDLGLNELLPLARINVCECEETAFSLSDWQRLQQWRGDFDAVYVACAHDVLTTAAARRLAALRELTRGSSAPGTETPPIVACLQQPPGSLCSIQSDSAGELQGSGVLQFNVFDECLREGETYPGQDRDAEAMLVMMKYQQKLNVDTTQEDAKAAWRKEPEEFRWSNRLAADHIALKLQVAPGLADKPLTIGSALLEQLCRLEHRRFVAERLLEGWLPTTAAKNAALRLNPTLIPFDSLVTVERKKDEAIVQATPLIRKVVARWKATPPGA